MRILRVSQRVTPSPGGKEVHVEELTRAQARFGDYVTVVYQQGDATQWGAHDALHVPSSRFTGALGALEFGFKVLRRCWTDDVPVDVVHLHGDFSELLPLLLLGWRKNAPVVLTVHGRLNPRFGRWTGWIYRRAARIIALGVGTAGDLTDRGVSSSRITIGSSGLNMGLIEVARNGGSDVIPGLVVSTGTLDPVKNHEAVIRAVNRLPQNLEARLWIIGDGPKLERDRLMAVAGGQRRIEFLGRRPRAEVYAITTKAQIFVLMSKTTATKGEGVPTALLEAMSLGRHCIISSDATPVPVVQDESSYQVVEDEDELERALLDALSSPQVSERFGARAQEATRHLGWEYVAQRMGGVLAEAVTANQVRQGVRGARSRDH